MKTAETTTKTKRAHVCRNRDLRCVQTHFKGGRGVYVCKFCAARWELVYGENKQAAPMVFRDGELQDEVLKDWKKTNRIKAKKQG